MKTNICLVAVILVAPGVLACGDGRITDTGPGENPSPTFLPALSCTLSDALIFSGGVARDGIPSLEDPPLVSLDDPELSYLEDYAANAASDVNLPDPRVVGIFIGSTPVAIPFNILWWHEIVNLDIGGRRVSITYCPLTGTAIAFDLSAANIQRFGVSGLIFQNNLIMFDEETESLWPQMCLNAADGDRSGFELQTVPVAEMLWKTWKQRYPQSLVVSRKTGYGFDYRRYPYFSYEASDLLLFPLPYLLDNRVPMKERVIGMIDDAGTLAIPFSQLQTIGAQAALNFSTGPDRITVLWDRAGQTAMAFRPFNQAGEPATISVVNGQFVDDETGSHWTIDGRAITGSRLGERLRHHEASYVAYWFAWASFFPRTQVWNE